MAQPARPRKAFAGLLPTAPALPARLGCGSIEEIVPVCLVRLARRLQMHLSPAAASVRPVRCYFDLFHRSRNAQKCGPEQHVGYSI